MFIYTHTSTHMCVPCNTIFPFLSTLCAIIAIYVTSIYFKTQNTMLQVLLKPSYAFKKLREEKYKIDVKMPTVIEISCL